MPQAVSSWILRVALVLSVAATLAACDEAVRPDGPGSGATRTATEPSQGVLFIAAVDGSVVVVNAGSPGEPLENFERELFLPTPYGTAKQITYDPGSSYLWYSDECTRIAALNVITLEPGPTLDGFSDVAILGCSVDGRARTMSVDSKHGRLLVPALTGALLEYDLRDLSLVGAISPDAFEGVTAGFRRIAVDSEKSRLWYATYDGSLIELDLESGTGTGRSAMTVDAVGPLSFDQAGRQLLFTTSDGELHYLDVDTLELVRGLEPPGGVPGGIAWGDALDTFRAPE